jgi:hypothetical protein
MTISTIMLYSKSEPVKKLGSFWIAVPQSCCGISGCHCYVADSWELIFGVVPWDILKMEIANFSRRQCYITNQHGVKSLKTVAFSDCHFQRKVSDGRFSLPDTCE